MSDQDHIGPISIDDDTLVFSVSYAISKTGLRPRHKDADKNARERTYAARTILEQLEMSGYVFYKKPPAPWNSIP